MVETRIWWGHFLAAYMFHVVVPAEEPTVVAAQDLAGASQSSQVQQQQLAVGRLVLAVAVVAAAWIEPS